MLRHPTLTGESAERVLQRGMKQTEALMQAKTAVAANFILGSLPDANEIRAGSEILKNSGLFARLFSARYRKARGLYEKISRGVNNSSKRDPGEEMAGLSHFLDQKRSLENDVEFRRVIGIAFRGIDTQWKELLDASRWISKVRQELTHSSDGDMRCLEILVNGDSTRIQEIAKAATVDGLIDNLKSFLQNVPDFDMPVDALCKAIEDTATRTGALISKIRQLHINPSLKLSKLEVIADQVAAFNDASGRLQARNAQEILANLSGDQATKAQILRSLLKFSELLPDMPEEVRTKIFRGPVKNNLDKLKTSALSVMESWQQASRNETAVKVLAKLNEPHWTEGCSLEQISIEKLRTRITYALNHRDDLQTYLDFLRVEQKAKLSTLGPLLKHSEGADPPYARLDETYDFTFYRSCAEEILSADPKLRSHSGITHEQLRKRYGRLDREIMGLRRLEIVGRLIATSVPAGNSQGRASEFSELALIRRQIGLQRRHVAVRDLLKRAGHAAQALKPCFMMSPMSLAQFLDPSGLRFDLVIMDEASQIRPEDALGAIARGMQLVVVGDPMQLPPTSFFEKVDRDTSVEDNSEETDIQELTSQESILDIARGPYQPIRQLRWHYRSQHEKLIAFSNHEFYEDTLVVFPSPKGDDEDFGIRLIQVQGVYDTGLNRREAESIIEAVQEFMHRFPNRSLGIVAMNKAQQDLIQKMLDELFATDVEAESYRLRWENSLESVIVKNLENVQGDERDVIFISTVYGKDAAGNFFQRLGPINGPHGHRRLNVLFTRAKQQIRIFTSMTANDLRIESSTRWGVKALKNYLAYAQSGHLDLGEISGRGPDSEFERWVMGMLTEAGYEVVPQLGVAGYFIDLAVRNPRQRGSFVMGIECDGRMYHSARSARDRDRLRQEVLERLQWSIYRIWSTDWFRNPRAEFRKLILKIDSLLHTEPPSSC